VRYIAQHSHATYVFAYVCLYVEKEEQEVRLEEAYPGAEGTYLDYFQDLLLRQVRRRRRRRRRPQEVTLTMTADDVGDGDGDGVLRVIKVEALVSECGVSPLLPGVVRKLWFRYLTTREGQVANNEAYRNRLANRSSTPHHHPLCRALLDLRFLACLVRWVRCVALWLLHCRGQGEGEEEEGGGGGGGGTQPG
jgi:hypothetical protein